MEKSIPDQYIKEMKAFAKAAGMKYEDILLANTVFDIKRAIFCTTFVATGKRSADGKPVFGRNLDFPTMGVAHRFSCVIVHHPTKGHAVASVSFPGLIGVLSGLSDAGVAAAVMEVHRQGAQIQAPPYAMVFRAALVEADTTAAVIKIVTARARTSTNNLMVCDADGNAVALELGMKKTAARPLEDGFVYATNHFRSQKFGEPRPCWRIPKLKKIATNGQKLDEAAAQKLLQSVSFQIMTMQSIVFRPASREFLLAIGKPPASKEKFVRLTSGVLFPKRENQ
jgi:predicted choloylglycine hydrolase